MAKKIGYLPIIKEEEMLAQKKIMTITALVPAIHSGEENNCHHDNFQNILVQKHVL